MFITYYYINIYLIITLLLFWCCWLCLICFVDWCDWICWWCVSLVGLFWERCFMAGIRADWCVLRSICLHSVRGCILGFLVKIFTNWVLLDQFLSKSFFKSKIRVLFFYFLNMKICMYIFKPSFVYFLLIVFRPLGTSSPHIII